MGKRKLHHIKIINKSNDVSENSTTNIPHLAAACGWDMYEEPLCPSHEDDCGIDYS